MSSIIDWVLEDPRTRMPILAALIGVGGTLLGGLFTTILWPLLKHAVVALGKASRRLSVTRAFEARYLRHLISEHRYLPILPTSLVPVAERQVHELDKLYVSLSIKKAGLSAEPIDVAAAFRGNRKLVVLGDPGSGKTTMLRFVALTLARARAGTPHVRFGSQERKVEAARSASARERVRNDFGYDDRPLPVFLYLNRLRNVSSLLGLKSLLHVIRAEWQATGTLAPVPPDYLQRKLDEGQCVLLFDAFDELGSQEARAAAAQYIGELASATADKGNRFIVTSRIVGYNGQLAKYGFEPVTLQALSWESVCTLVRQWYDSLTRPDLSERLIETLRLNPRIAELAVNPMLLSLIVLVQYVRGLIPDKRHVLYDECVKILVERRYAPPDVQQEYNKTVPGDDAIRVLRELAMRMHLAHIREVPRRELESALIPGIVADMKTSPVAGLTAADLLNNIESRSQLVVERGLNDEGRTLMAFSHLTFQEYLTSVALREEAIVRSEAAVTGDLLRKYASDREWWEEVALLYAAQLPAPQQKGFFDRLFPAPH